MVILRGRCILKLAVEGKINIVKTTLENPLKLPVQATCFCSYNAAAQ